MLCKRRLKARHCLRRELRGIRRRRNDFNGERSTFGRKVDFRPVENFRLQPHNHLAFAAHERRRYEYLVSNCLGHVVHDFDNGLGTRTCGRGGDLLLRSCHKRRFPERCRGTRGFLREIDNDDFFGSRSALLGDNWFCRRDFRFDNGRFNDRRSGRLYDRRLGDRRGRRHWSCGDDRRARVWRNRRLNDWRRDRRGRRHWSCGDDRRARVWRNRRNWCLDCWPFNYGLFNNKRFDNLRNRRSRRRWRSWRDNWLFNNKRFDNLRNRRSRRRWRSWRDNWLFNDNRFDDGGDCRGK